MSDQITLNSLGTKEVRIITSWDCIVFIEKGKHLHKITAAALIDDGFLPNDSEVWRGKFKLTTMIKTGHGHTHFILLDGERAFCTTFSPRTEFEVTSLENK